MVVMLYVRLKLGNGYITTLSLEVFIQRNFIRLKLNCILQNKIIAFWVILWGLGGNVSTPSIACWKTHGRLSICHKWTFFGISYGWDVISGNLSKFKVGVSQRGWVTLSANFRRKGRCPPTTVSVRTLHCVSKKRHPFTFTILIEIG